MDDNKRQRRIEYLDHQQFMRSFEAAVALQQIRRELQYLYREPEVAWNTLRKRCPDLTGCCKTPRHTEEFVIHCLH